MDRRSIPDDLVVEILSWLPVKSVIKFKLVCKIWCWFIGSKQFVSKHAENWGGNVNNSSLLVGYHCFRQQLVSLCTEDGNGDLCIDMNRNENKAGVDRQVGMCGPCNGLVCLYGRRDDSTFTLWNPTIGETKVLPRSLVPRPGGVGVNVCYYAGLGFDSVTSDYKVVKFLCGSPTAPVYQVEIYSLRTNSWRKYDDSAGLVNLSCSIYCFENSTSYRNEIYCWLATCTNSASSAKVVLSFDMCNEVFVTTLLPQDTTQLKRKKICSLHDSLALIFYSDINSLTHMTIEIWTIKDILHVEGSSSWTKITSIGGFDGMYWPLGLCSRNSNGDSLLILGKKNGEMVYTDIGGGKIATTRNVFGWDVKRYLSWILPNYIETLVSVNHII